MRILLFDLDGVLVEPRAYHQALRETVALVGRALGYREVKLTQADIEIFESVNVTSEWDSSAICTALLLRRIWRVSPDTTLPQTPPLPRPVVHELSAPDFQAFFRSDGMIPLLGILPTLLAERSLLSEENAYSAVQEVALRSILRGAGQAERSLTHRIFQELVLGSQVFESSYRMLPHLNTDGYLQYLDRPTLTEGARDKLLAWLGTPDHRAVIITNRPSQPPRGFFGTPEAELGLETAKLQELPLVGRSGLAWLAEQRGLAPDELLKPSAAHTLAALRRASGDTLEAALRAAGVLALDRYADPSWESLIGAEIYVFEDSADGLQSVLAAQGYLARIGVPVETKLVGVTRGLQKRRSLEAAGAQVFHTIPEALQHSGAIT